MYVARGRTNVDVCPLRGEPTENIDGNYHRNKTIKFWSNGITCLYRKYMVFPLRNTFTIENEVNGQKIIEIHRK